VRANRFAIGTFSAGENDSFTGLVLGDHVAPLEPHLGDTVSVRSLLEDWDESLAELQGLADRLGLEDCEHRLEQLRPLPPVQPAGQLFQAGANYKQHLIELLGAGNDRTHHLTSAEERQSTARLLDERARTGAPYVFVGVSYSLAGANDDIVLPSAVQQPDWELELAVVIGRPAHRVPRERALDFIAGYTIGNDITARDRVFRPDVAGIGTDWLAGKGWPTFSPVGPYIVPAAHVPDPHDLQITLRLNGQVMQDSSTSDMMFGIDRLIEYASSITELRPGDLLLTGSPAGNGVHHGRFLAPGDVIESEITLLGRQRNTCVAEAQAVASAPRWERRTHA
jgi:2-keto-4-pentenoate hydratase/2-oxohepta-3-ene-1,7-dioic acid hydratase in catechol pathway